MSELEMLFNKGNEIDLGKPKEKGFLMSFWKTTGQVTVGLIVLAAGIYGAGLYHNAQAGLEPIHTSKDQKKRVSQTIAFTDAEERDLNRIQKYCFSVFPWDHDGPTCKVWLRHYRELGEYSDKDLFKEELEYNADLAFERHGITPGNEQSPVE